MKKIKNRDLPPDALCSLPSFLLTGQSECIIDGKCELVYYSENCISFDIFYKSRILSIHGENLTLSCISQGSCAVCGKIERLEFVSKKSFSENGVSIK